jgi:hypothetical protein
MAGTKYYGTVSNKIEPLESNTPNLSSNNVSALKSAFPQSPIYLNVNQGGINEEEREESFEILVMTGEVINGNGISNYNRDFSKNGAPDIPNITHDGINNSGDPLYSPYVPNPTSPGAGSLDANDKPMHSVPAPNPIDVSNKQFGVGFSGVFNPLESAEYIESLSIKRPLGVSSNVNEV